MGGVRGITEASVPVVVFVLVNVVWSLNPALIASTAVALAIIAYRLRRRESIRHAINGMVGVGVGALIAWRTGEAKDFYLPGILMSLAYGVLLIISAVARHPVIGYMWAVIAAGGKHLWRTQPRLLRTFQWLSLAWAGMFLAKGLVQGALWLAEDVTWLGIDEETWLGIARVGMGVPPYLLMLGVTVWAVRRVTHSDEAVAGDEAVAAS
ncbi:MAG: DUF3159 domain-containing protein [Micromonosporaceae bacterium]|nr:DUF3159 domain-containing protein [Micromonosporaceae bacterium]